MDRTPTLSTCYCTQNTNLKHEVCGQVPRESWIKPTRIRKHMAQFMEEHNWVRRATCRLLTRIVSRPHAQYAHKNYMICKISTWALNVEFRFEWRWCSTHSPVISRSSSGYCDVNVTGVCKLWHTDGRDSHDTPLTADHWPAQGWHGVIIQL